MNTQTKIDKILVGLQQGKFPVETLMAIPQNDAGLIKAVFLRF